MKSSCVARQGSDIVELCILYQSYGGIQRVQGFIGVEVNLLEPFRSDPWSNDSCSNYEQKNP